MPSQPSTTASATDTKDLTQNGSTAEAQAKLEELRKHQQIDGEPKRPRESMKKTLRFNMPDDGLSDDERDKRSADVEQERAERQRQHRAKEIIRASNLPLRHLKTRKTGLLNTPGGEFMTAESEAIEAVQNRQCVMLCGPRGPGKTQIATCVGVDCAERGVSVHYTDAADLFMHCREGMHEGKESERLKRYENYGLLIIDECHVRGESDYEDRLITRILNNRYNNLKPTMLITNQKRSEAAKSLGSSVVSRLHESGVVIECNWRSFRTKEQA